MATAYKYAVIAKSTEDIVPGVGVVVIDSCGHLILRALPTDGTPAGPVLVAYAPGAWNKVQQIP